MRKKTDELTDELLDEVWLTPQVWVWASPCFVGTSS